MREKIDILVFGGQSNMQGETESLPEKNTVIEKAFEYRFLTDEFLGLRHPVGEDIDDTLLLGASQGKGSLVPDFCREYIKSTGKNVAAIHVARGATTISEWLKGTARYDCSLNKIQSGIKKAKENYEIDKIYYIWLQGESDAIERTTKADYISKLTEYKNDIKTDIGIDKFGIIEVGYFCGTVDWLEDRTRDQGKIDDEVIMSAQEYLTENDNDFVMLTQICKEISLDENYINPFVVGHYNNEGMKTIGSLAAKTLANL